MEKTYDPQQIEKKWYQSWESSGYFNPNPSAEPYCIMLPPPNVTGSLHMGHGFQDTLMDALIRYHRMLGENVLWQVGTDHAGIATQMVVERQLQAQNKTRHDLGREEFVKKVWEWKHQSGGIIANQMRRMGVSADWSRECFTMDAHISDAVNEVFVRLYEEGLIYRGKRLVNWDPQLLTAISDLEVISEETQGEIWYIRYPLLNGKDHITVATTRPETLLGDVAVAVHPEDERYKHLIGQQVKLPLTDRTIPIIGDDQVEKDFGTGCVKITPGHDFNDYAMGQRHQLPLINIFTPTAHLNENVPKPYQGLERFAARKKIIADLTAQNLLEKTAPHALKIPRGDRSGVVVEPLLTDQWFMKMTPLAQPAIKAVENGSVKFIPETWAKTYFIWLNNIQDWCISRQLWWGHRIPAWQDDHGKIYVGRSEQEVRQKNNLNTDVKLTQDTDVLDTWFSAALWPFATLGWPQQTPEFKMYYPTSVLVTGFDIIFFWVARMIMLGLKFTGDVPFREVYVTGLIRDHEGHKMSKSKGNVLDPIDLIDGIDLEKLVAKRITGLMQPALAKKIETVTRKQFPQGIPAFGTDALRFTYCALASTGRDIRFDLNRVEGYRNFCNKLWNAARFVMMNVGVDDETKISNKASPLPLGEGQGEGELSLPDRWILSRLQQTIQQAHEHFKHYRFDLLAQELYEFTWNEYCDWYLEFAKVMLNPQHPHPSPLPEGEGTKKTLIHVLEILLRLMHPLMPFITEEIWQRVAPIAGVKGKTIMLQAYPEFNPEQINSETEQEINWIKKIVESTRMLRSTNNISPSKQVTLSIQAKEDPGFLITLQKHQHFITALAKAEHIHWMKPDAPQPTETACVVGHDYLLYLHLTGLIDKGAETARLQKEYLKTETEHDKLAAKLNNSNFIAKAPPEVVHKDKTRLAELASILNELKAKLAQLNNEI